MFGHKFDPVTRFCVFCGVSRSAVVGGKFSCYPDKTNLTAIKPYIAKRDMAQKFERDGNESDRDQRG